MNSCIFIYLQSIHSFSEPEIAKFEFIAMIFVYLNKDILRFKIPMGYFELIMKIINSLGNLIDYIKREIQFNSFIFRLHVLAKIIIAQLHFDICKICSFLDQIVDIHNTITIFLHESSRQFNLLIIIIIRLIALNLSTQFLNSNIYVSSIVAPFVDSSKSSFTKNVLCIVFQC